MLADETGPEPIVENYELEKLEEKQYMELSFDDGSVDSPKSFSNGTVAHIHHSNQMNFQYADRDSISSTAADQQFPPAYQSQVSSGSGTAPPGASSDRRRFGQSLSEKRSFLVRMVSDPKCYNPKIVRHLNMRNHKQMSQDLFRDRSLRQAIESSSSTKRRPSRFPPGKCKKESIG